MMNAKRLFILAGASVMISGFYAFYVKHNSMPAKQNVMTTAGVKSQNAIRALGGAAPALSSSSASVAKAPAAKVQTQTPAQQAHSTAALQRYAKIKAKVFLSADDKAERESLLRDGGLLMQLKAMLMAPARGVADWQLQDQAVDLLLQARSEVNSSEATAVLRSLIEDARIEDAKFDVDARKALAERKAELLFLWTSQEPARAVDMQLWLPGPVSRKIWTNVLAAQKQNQDESKIAAH